MPVTRPSSTLRPRKRKAVLRCVSCEDKHLKCESININGPCQLCIQEGPTASAKCVLLSAEERRIKRVKREEAKPPGITPGIQEGEEAANSLLKLAQPPIQRRSYVPIAKPARTFEELLDALKREMKSITTRRPDTRAMHKCEPCAIAKISTRKCRKGGDDLGSCTRCVRLKLHCAWPSVIASGYWERVNGTNLEVLRRDVKVYDENDNRKFVENLGQRLLLWAACFGQLRVVELLVDMGVDVDFSDNYEDTCLHLTVRKGNTPMVRTLLSVGASVNVKNRFKKTPIFYAVENGDEKLIKCLLEAGAGTNDRDRGYGFTPLHHAMWTNHCPAIELLLAAGSDPNTIDYGGETALFWAKSEEVVKMLIRWGGKVNVRNNQQRTPLHEEIRGGGSLAISFALLDAGADPNARDEKGKTALHFAAEKGDIENVQHLLQNKSDPDIEDDEGNMPLHIAASRGNVSVFKALIDGGAPLYQPPEYYDHRKGELFRAWWDSKSFTYDPKSRGYLIPDFDRLSLDKLGELLEEWRFYLVTTVRY